MSSAVATRMLMSARWILSGSEHPATENVNLHIGIASFIVLTSAPEFGKWDTSQEI